MPKLADAIFAQHYDSVVKLAARDNGVSRMELMSSLGVTRIVADKLIENTKLVPGPKIGRTEFFKVAAIPATSAAPTLPTGATAGVLNDDSNKPTVVGLAATGALVTLGPPVAAPPVAPPVAPKTPPLDDDDKVEEEEEPDVAAEIDEQIVAVKKLVASDCSELGKAHERLVLHQAMLTALLTRRVAL